MRSAALLLMVATLLARVVGYLRDAYVAWAFGAGPVTDAYVAAFTLPDFLLYLLAGGAISVAFIPLYTRYVAENKPDEANRLYSIVISTLVVAFIVAVIVGEMFAGAFVAWWFPGFTAEQVALCTWLTRLLLPQPVFFMIGGVASAVQQSQRQFLLPAVAPIVYTIFIILGGVLLSRQMGIAALAVGATTGAFAGPFLLNALGARQAGVRFRFAIDTAHPGFRQWLRMSIPLMIGVSVVAADDWILRSFASGGGGDITRLNYAKRLLFVPIGVLGQAAGVASLPFFARLWSEKKLDEFGRLVNRSVTKLGSACILATAWMVAVALPLTDLAFRRGRFTQEDTQATAMLVSVFAFALFFWAVQGLYARAFFAAGNMVTPMAAGTLVTLISIPVYWWLSLRMGALGLALASNLAILFHTLVLAVLLRARGVVPTGGLDWAELGKALVAGVIAGWLAAKALGAVPLSGSRADAALQLGMATLTWSAGALGILWLMRAELLKKIRG